MIARLLRCRRELIYGGSVALLLCLGTRWNTCKMPVVHAQAVSEFRLLSPPLPRGQGVTGVYEGWFQPEPGQYALVFGYFNRNSSEELDIPIGPNNSFEPGDPDRGQPTHFLPGREWGMFVVKVPAEAVKGGLRWTLSAHGARSVVVANVGSDYEISPLREAAVGNTPPAMSFDIKGKVWRGPMGESASRTTTVNTPLPLNVLVSDDAKYTSKSGARPTMMPPPVTVRWSLYRGDGQMRFDDARPAVKFSTAADGDGATGAATNSVAFDQPGHYWLHVVANDYSGPGGGTFQCCWTNGVVRVDVNP